MSSNSLSFPRISIPHHHHPLTPQSLLLWLHVSHPKKVLLFLLLSPSPISSSSFPSSSLFSTLDINNSGNNTPLPHQRQSDAFLYNSFAMDLITCVGYNILFFGSYFNLPDMMLVGPCFETVASWGQDFFHLLSYVERYLAVVKPITYRRLRHARGVNIKYISIGCVWFLSFLYLTQTFLGNEKLNMILYFCFVGFFLIGTFFFAAFLFSVFSNTHVQGNRVGRESRLTNQSRGLFTPLWQ